MNPVMCHTGPLSGMNDFSFQWQDSFLDFSGNFSVPEGVISLKAVPVSGAVYIQQLTAQCRMYTIFAAKYVTLMGLSIF